MKHYTHTHTDTFLMVLRISDIKIHVEFMTELEQDLTFSGFLGDRPVFP